MTLPTPRPACRASDRSPRKHAASPALVSEGRAGNAPSPHTRRRARRARRRSGRRSKAAGPDVEPRLARGLPLATACVHNAPLHRRSSSRRGRCRATLITSRPAAASARDVAFVVCEGDDDPSASSCVDDGIGTRRACTVVAAAHAGYRARSCLPAFLHLPPVPGPWCVAEPARGVRQGGRERSIIAAGEGHELSSVARQRSRRGAGLEQLQRVRAHCVV